LASKGKQRFQFPYSRYKNLMTKQTFQRVKQELIDKGFIEVVAHNGNLRKPNEYKFSDRWKGI